ncbi:MAG TPA: gluconolactonase [Dehalococcoidia bacterium]|jgi:gluconolactonase|nr:gluconolactonase [Dehalococcoidia bacterium]|tara:strand:+ start:734 stop:1636 length:903 start_codon:yes stop_codon:yes gene_type:complete
MAIKQISDRLVDILDVSQEVEFVADGFGGDQGPTEGPLWWHEENALIFSDIHNNRRMTWQEGQEAKVLQDGTNQSNGLTRDLNGRLVACEHLSRRVVRLEHDGVTTVIANSFQGKQLNRPNDVIVKSDGSIYFTDPWSHKVPQNQWDLNFAGVYRVSPDLGTLTLLVSDFVFPNGLAFSEDEKFLYVNDSRKAVIRSFEVNPDGTLAKGTDRIFANVSGLMPGVADGMKVDVNGNVYCGGSGGLWIFDACGAHLGTIEHGGHATTNVAFGGENWDTLYFTTWNSVGRVKLKVKGTSVPVK